MPVQSKDKDSILYNHYLWCLREGRDTSWWFKGQASSVKPEDLHLSNTNAFTNFQTKSHKL